MARAESAAQLIDCLGSPSPGWHRLQSTEAATAAHVERGAWRAGAGRDARRTDLNRSSSTRLKNSGALSQRNGEHSSRSDEKAQRERGEDEDAPDGRYYWISTPELSQHKRISRLSNRMRFAAANFCRSRQTKDVGLWCDQAANLHPAAACAWSGDRAGRCGARATVDPRTSQLDRRTGEHAQSTPWQSSLSVRAVVSCRVPSCSFLPLCPSACSSLSGQVTVVAWPGPSPRARFVHHQPHAAKAAARL